MGEVWLLFPALCQESFDSFGDGGLDTEMGNVGKGMTPGATPG